MLPRNYINTLEDKSENEPQQHMSLLITAPTRLFDRKQIFTSYRSVNLKESTGLQEPSALRAYRLKFGNKTPII